MKKIFKLLILCTAIIFSFVGCGEKKVKTLQLGFTTAANPDDPYFVFGNEFAKIVEEKSGGKLKIDLMAGGQLGQEREMFEGMQIGTVDMAIMTNAYASNFVPASGVFDLPFIFKDNETAAKILDGPLGTKVLKSYEEKNVKALAWGEGGFRHLVTMKDEVRKPADFKGLKIRCMETKTYIATYEALNANAVPMAWSETITGLQQGTIDGLDIPISVIYSNGFPEIAHTLSLTGHFYSPLIMSISLGTWNDLSEKNQKILTEAAKEAGNRNRAHNAKVEGEMLGIMESQGMTIVKDVNTPSFQETLKNFYMEQKDNIGGNYVEELLKALSE